MSDSQFSIRSVSNQLYKMRTVGDMQWLESVLQVPFSLQSFDAVGWGTVKAYKNGAIIPRGSLPKQ